MPWIAPVIGGAMALGGGIAGASAASGNREASIEAYQKSVQDLEAVGVPSIEAQQIVFERYKSAGMMTPEMQEAVKLGDSNMVGVSTDPAYKEAQLRALSQLEDIGSSGGMRLSDRAQLENTMGGIDADARGRRQGILMDAQQRGGYGNGSALVAQLMNQQDASQKAHQTGLGIAAQAQQRALDSIIQGGQLGSQFQQQQFAQKAQQAQAQDLINKWNAENSQSVRAANTTARNNAQQWNLQNQQNITNANADTTNKERLYNAGLYQQKFQNDLAKAQSKANARAGQASNLTQQGNQAAQGWANIGSGLAQAGAAVGQTMQNSQDRAADRDLYKKAYGIEDEE